MHFSSFRVCYSCNQARKILYKQGIRNDDRQKTNDKAPVARNRFSPEASLKSSIQNADTYPHKVKKANHPKGWDAKPRDLIWEARFPRVCLVATGSKRSTDLNAPIHKKDGHFGLWLGKRDEGSPAEKTGGTKISPYSQPSLSSLHIATPEFCLHSATATALAGS